MGRKRTWKTAIKRGRGHEEGKKRVRRGKEEAMWITTTSEGCIKEKVKRKKKNNMGKGDLTKM
jgi:hypothetical protein